MTNWGLLRWDQVPAHTRERFIHGGYRPLESGLAYSIRTAFSLHNQTGNVWTHTLPIFYFLYFLLLDEHVCGQWESLRLEQRILLLNYFLATFMLFLTSSCVHLLSCAGARCWHDVCFALDYAAICLFGVASSIVYYFMLRPVQVDTLGGSQSFLAYTFLATVFAMSTCCWSSQQPGKLLNALRVAAFAAPFFIGSTPMFDRYASLQSNQTSTLTRISSHEVIGETAISYQKHSEPDHTFNERYTRHLLMMMAGGLVNAAKIPERLWPGCFDIFGHSHQIFHLFIFFGIREQFWLIMDDIAHHQSHERIMQTMTSSSTFLMGVTMCGLVVALLAVLVVLVVTSLPLNDGQAMSHCDKDGANLEFQGIGHPCTVKSKDE